MSAALNTKAPYPTLQRRRRRSDQLSPTSPSYSRRFFDRPNRVSDAVNSADTTPVTDDADSPSLHTALTSADQDHLATLPSAPPVTESLSTDSKTHQAYQRASEESSRPRLQASEESARPATSDAAQKENATPGLGSRSPLAGPDYSTRPSPVPYASNYAEYRDRKPLDPPIRFGDNASSPTLRNYSFPSHPTSDDGVPQKRPEGRKSRLNLLNPMSLLARRRSSQKLEDVSLSINTLAVPALPDNFDPSIRGNLVHDFSAPRSRRLYSQNDLESPALRSGYGSDPSRSIESPGRRLGSGGTPGTAHSPMFKEHFQDDRPSLQPERTGYLHNIHALNSARDRQDTGPMPAFAKKLPPVVPPRDLEGKPRIPGKDEMPLPSPPPPTPPPKGTPSPKFDVPPPAAIPKHMTSTSSRFSFQISGNGSAQEKLLEEKHKQHEATKKTSGLGLDEEEDEFADFDFDADDGLEEMIPGVNADFDEDDGFGTDIPEANALVARHGAPLPEPPSSSDPQMPGLQQQSLQSFHFTPQSLTFSPTSTNNGSQPTPRDQDGFAIGIADSRDPSHDGHSDLYATDDVVGMDKLSLLGGLGISADVAQRRRSAQISRPQGQVFDDEDLYFDDGEFDHVEMEPSPAKFDEQIFDDDSVAIRDIPAENARKLEAAQRAAGPDGARAVDSGQSGMAGHPFEENAPPGGPRGPHASDPAHFGHGDLVTGLTETNLAAYHDALASAANQAAAEGKFDRKVSFSQNSDATSRSPLESSQLGVISDESRFSYNFGSAMAEDDGFPLDDDMDDDLMIAEANAEVLENDDDGFYGQEFGFYARTPSKGNVELVNGGYFAERGSNGVKRSHSGKANFQEPSLTPITERSEWSTRNSVASLQIPGGLAASAQSLPSPGIAQLLELDSPAYDEDLSFGALMKLRGRTFGNSSSSIGSSGPHSASSPLAQTSSHPFSHSDGVAARMSSSMHGRSSPARIPEFEEEEDEGDRPTLTQNTPRKKTTDSDPVTSWVEMPVPPSPVSAGGERRKGHHSRTSSGAESVSYARDTDGRWVLERRRTDEDSGTEVVDREYLAGARI